MIISGRDDKKYESTVGPFLNTVCIRLELGSNPTSPAKVAESLYESLEHSRLPFNEVVAALGRRQSTVHPVCQVLLVPQSFAEARVDLTKIGATRVQVPQHPHPFHLVVETWSDASGAVSRLAAAGELVGAPLTSIAKRWATLTGVND